MWEEPPISGEAGSGTVFFSGCTLRCVYCQNHAIATGEVGLEISVERLAEIFLEQQKIRRALNINLVTPTHFWPLICDAIDMARSRGLVIPIIANTSGYERPEVIKALGNRIDAYLTDFKYASSTLAQRYSMAADYPKVASAALDAMYAAVGPYSLGRGVNGEEGILQRGIIVRHLMLPGHLDDSMRVMDILASKPYADNVWVSLMNQYTPMEGVGDRYPELAGKVTEDEYDELIDYALDLGLENSFMQEGGTAEESFIPAFDYEGVLSAE